MNPTNTYPNGQSAQPPVQPASQSQPPVIVQPVSASGTPAATPPPPAVSPGIESGATPVAPTQVVQQPLEVAPAPQPQAVNTDAIYPTALNQEQRAEQREEVRAQSQMLLQRPLSQLMILLVVAVVGARVLFDDIKSLFGIGVPDAMVMFASGAGYVWQERIVSILTIALVIAAVYAAYRTFRGSKLALSLLTGAVIMHIFAALIYFGHVPDRCL
jgi:hypothetical protein